MAPSLLVLTDFFQAANQALDYATSLAGPLQARLVLLHVREQADAASPSLTNLNPDAVGLALNCLAQELPVPVVAEVGCGPLPDVVADAVQRHHPALLVLGHAEPTDEPVATTAQRLLQAAPYPMLVVPVAPARHRPLRRLLVAVDGQPFSLGVYAGAARHLLRGLQAELTLFHCPPAGEPAADAPSFADAVLRTGLTIDLPPVQTRCVAAEHPAEAILAAARSGAFDAVVLVARPRSFWGQLFHRSVTAQVLHHCPLPVLVLPAVV